MNDIKNKFYLMVDLSKFISNKKILDGVKVIGSTKFVIKLCLYWI